MQLFHCSNEKYATLTPQVGARRHDGEGPDVAGKAVIWLSNDGTAVFRHDGQVLGFRHEVEILDSDPDLVLDQKFAEFMQQAEQLYSIPMPMRWYAYGKPLQVQSVAEYDDASEKYVTVEPTD